MEGFPGCLVGDLTGWPEEGCPERVFTGDSGRVLAGWSVEDLTNCPVGDFTGVIRGSLVSANFNCDILILLDLLQGEVLTF